VANRQWRMSNAPIGHRAEHVYLTKLVAWIGPILGRSEVR
jgi:hypothetical protein